MSGIRLRDLTKSYGSKLVLNHITADLPSGILCLSGSSGCGKTTLARILAGLEKPDCGFFEGITGPVAFLFQEPRLFPAFSALENVSCVGRVRSSGASQPRLRFGRSGRRLSSGGGGPGSIAPSGSGSAPEREAEGEARTLLRRLLLTDEDMDKRPAALSGGMNQRVAIARLLLFASACGGNTVLLDEPFKGLDEISRQAAAELVLERLVGKNLLVITHDRTDASLLGAATLSFEDLARGIFL